MKSTIKDLKNGDFFTLKDYGEETEVKEKNVWVRGDYDKASKTYSCCKYSDANHEHFFRGTKEVYIDFYF